MVDQNGILQLSNNIVPRYRYPGFQPFTQQQEHIFFGRDKNIDNQSRSVMQNPCTVIFGKSGIGKSSLINAGLLPKIAQQNKNGSHSYCSISTFRFGAYNSEAKDGGQVIDKFNSALPDVDSSDNFLPGLRPEIKKTFWYKLKLRQFSAYSNNKTETFILVFDQLEQLF